MSLLLSAATAAASAALAVANDAAEPSAVSPTTAAVAAASPRLFAFLVHPLPLTLFVVGAVALVAKHFLPPTSSSATSAAGASSAARESGALSKHNSRFLSRNAQVVRYAPAVFDFALHKDRRLRLDLDAASLVEYDPPPHGLVSGASAHPSVSSSRDVDPERAALLPNASSSAAPSTLSSESSASSASSSPANSDAGSAPDDLRKPAYASADLATLTTHYSANLRHVAVDDKGLHLEKGRAISLRSSENPNRVLTFASRRAANAFAHVLAHAQRSLSIPSAAPVAARAPSLAAGPADSKEPQPTEPNHARTKLQTRALSEPLPEAEKTGTGPLATPEALRLFVTTFNVGEARPPDDLSPWLARTSEADIVAVGVQECSYALPSEDSDEEDEANEGGQKNEKATHGEASSSSGNAEGPSDGLRELLSREDDAEDGDDSGSAGSSDSTLLNESSVANLERGDDEADGETAQLQGEEQQQQSTRRKNHQHQQQGRLTRFNSDKEHWHALLAANLPPGEFDCVVQHAAWNRSLSIYARRSLRPHITKARVDTCNVGIGGVAGNKGAIAARFSVHDTAFLIVNSHLAAHHGEVLRRNGDFAAIAGGLHNLRDDASLDALSDAVHHTIWLGDLNYRVDLPREDVLRLAAERDWAKLQAADQLRAEMRAGRVFEGFKEGVTDFAPTYRYERGSRRYSEYKRRIPSYCDRVLFRSLPSCPLELQEYDACDDIMTSDHSPVWATLTAQLARTTGRVPLDCLTDVLGQGEEEVDGEKGTDGTEGPQNAEAEATPKPGGDENGAASTSEPSAEPSAQPSLSKTHMSKSRLLTAQFRGLQARGIPAMEFPGRRMAVAKALHLDGALAWKKHVDEGEGRQADPYCVFHGAAVCDVDGGAARARTTTSQMCQNPLWTSDQIPTVALVDSHRDVLAFRHLVISVWDENVSRADRLIGSAVVSLEPAADEQPINFTVPIMRAGKRNGELSGEFVVR